MSAGGTLFVGDAHLEAGDPGVDALVDLIASRAGRERGIVLLGDLFNLWVGRPEFEGPHHRAVTEALAAARSRGTEVHYVEGNRDYRIADRHLGTAFDRVARDGLDLACGDLRVHAVHGDLANTGDVQYRAWRAVSRSAPFWWLLRCVPTRSRAALADRVERRMRSSNLRHKRAFPAERVRRYGRRILAGGRDLVVLGHFHDRHVLPSGDPAVPGTTVVLPLWTERREHLRVDPDGTWSFERSGG